MCVQQAVSDAYALAKGARPSVISRSNVIGIRAMQPDSNPTRPDDTGRVRIVGVGSGRVITVVSGWIIDLVAAL